MTAENLGSGSSDTPNPRRDELADWLSDEHAFDDMNSRCECGWYYASPETFEEHLADALFGWLEEHP